MPTLKDATRPYRVYVDTSVFGGCLDAGYDVDSRRLMGYAKAGIVAILMSTIVSKEVRFDEPDES